MRSSSFIALLALPAQLVFAQAATSRGTSLTLDDAIMTAQRNNPQFLNVQNGLRSANAQVRQTYGALLPQVSSNFRTSYQQGGQQIVQGVALPGSTDSYNSSYSIGLSYSVAPSILYLPKAARAN